MARPPASDPSPAPAGTTRRRTRPAALRTRILECVSASLQENIPEFGQKGGPGILAGYSGGLDSTVLLHLLVEIGRRSGTPRDAPVVAAHLDHALRPDSPEQAHFAARVAASLGVPFRGGRREVARRARRERRSVEEAGRLERLDFFREVSVERGAFVVALGHTLTDQAETVLLRLARGAGGLGLGAMPPCRADERGFRIVRPLLGVSRAEIAVLAEAEGWQHYPDPENANPEFSRNRIRQEVLPLLRKTSNPQIEAALGRTAELLREDEACLQGLSARRFAEIAVVRQRGAVVEVSIAASAFGNTEPALERRLIREGLRTVRGHLRRIGLVHIEAALRIACARRGGASLDLPGATVRLERGFLTIIGVGEGRRTGGGSAPEPADSGSVLPGGR